MRKQSCSVAVFLALVAMLAGQSYPAMAEQCQAMAIKGEQAIYQENRKLEKQFRAFSDLARTFEAGSPQAERALAAGEENIRVQYDLDKLDQGYGMLLSGGDGYCRSRIGPAGALHQALRDRIALLDQELEDLTRLADPSQ